MPKRTSANIIPSLLTAASFGAVGVAALRLTRVVWRRNVDYASPYVAPLPPHPPAHPPLAQRLMFIVFDGLRCDAAMSMPTLVGLREQGVGLVARVGQPSLSLPGWTAMLTGAWQEISGVTSNWYTGAPPIESVLSLAKRGGLRTALVGDRVWQQLFGADADMGKYVQWQKALGAGRAIPDGYIVGPSDYTDKAGVMGSDAQLLEAALDFWTQQRPDLMVLHLSAADNSAHGYGGVSDEYHIATRSLDHALAAMLKHVDLGDTAVVVSSDHGHLDVGGHGGWEEVVLDSPLIMAGAGVRADGQGLGYSERVAQVDIAPTLCTLLGLPLPAHSQGRPLAEHLALDERDRAALDLAWLKQQSAFYRMYGEQSAAPEPLVSGVSIPRLEQDYAEGEYAEVSKAAHQAVRRLHAEARAWRMERLDEERLRRLPVAALLVALPVTAALALQHRPRPLLAALAAAAATNLGYRGLYAARGYRYSLSTFRRDDRLEQFFRERIGDAATCAVGSTVALALLQGGSPTVGATDAAATACWNVAIVGAQIAYFHYLWGIEYKWHLPDYRYAFKFYLDIVQFGGYALAALPSLGLARLVRKWVAGRGRASDE